MKRVIVVGGGISGLATAYLVLRKAQSVKCEVDVLLLEQDQRLGGKILSIKDNGFLCEWGPNGFLDSKPQTLDLCKALGASSQLLRSNDNARKRFISFRREAASASGKRLLFPEKHAHFLAGEASSGHGAVRLESARGCR